MSRRDDSPADFLPMESADHPGFAGRNKTIRRTPEIHRSRNAESPDSQSAAMEEDGLLTRKVYAEVPPRVEYTLTELGYSLHPILASMSRWGKAYQQMDIHQAR